MGSFSPRCPMARADPQLPSGLCPSALLVLAPGRAHGTPPPCHLPPGGSRAGAFFPQVGTLFVRTGLLRAESLWGLRTCPGVIQGQTPDLAPAQLWPSPRLSCRPQPRRAGHAVLTPRCVHSQRCEGSPCCLHRPTPCPPQRPLYHPSPRGLSCSAACPSSGALLHPSIMPSPPPAPLSLHPPRKAGLA